MRVESGTCNVCSAPCSSCMHYGLSLSANGSISESGFSSSICSRNKAKSSVFNVDFMPISKGRICDNSYNAENSNFLSMSTSHDSYSEIAESKTNLRASIANEVLSPREVFEEGTCIRNSDQVCTTPYVHLSSDLCRRFHRGLGEEHCESESHGDNILFTCGAKDVKVAASNKVVDIKEDIACSNVAISSFVKVNSPAVLGYGFQESESGENQWNSSGSNASTNLSSLDSNSFSPSGCTDASVKLQYPLCKNDVSSKICSLPSNSQAEMSLFLKYGSKDMERIVNLQPKEEITACSELNTVESSLASLTARSFSEHRSSSFTNHGAQTRIVFSSCNSNIDDLCKESKDTVLDKQFVNDLEGSNAYESLEKDDSILNATKSQVDHLQSQVIAEGGQSESDAVLYDVKVCDICGDAGREDLLATCSRCTDGAEHTYCMREKMHKVPEGDWLCEECNTKEIETREVDESKATSGRLKSTCFNEITHNSVSTFIPLKRPKLEDRTMDLDVQGWSKGLQSPNSSTRRQVSYLQEEKPSAEIASSMKKPVLPQQVSLRSRDSGNLKRANAAPSSEVWSTKGSESGYLSKTYFRSNSFNNRPNLHSPRGSISRSVSFSKLNLKPKVTKHIEYDPHKQKITRDLTNNDLREQSLVKSSTKFSSFKSTNLWSLNSESRNKTPFLPSHIGEIKSPKEVQERNIVEKRAFSAAGDPFFITSPGSRCLTKGSNDTSVLDGDKKEISCSAKIAGSSNGISRLDSVQKPKVLEEDTTIFLVAGDGSCRMANFKSQHTTTEFAQNRMRGSTMLVNSRLSAHDDNRKIHCKQCNGTGHATHHCCIDKFRGSSHKLAADWISTEAATTRNRWREAVGVVTSRNRASKNNKTEIIEEFPSVSVDVISEVPSNYTSLGSCKTNVPLIVQRHKDRDSSKDFDVHPIKPLSATSLNQQLLISSEATLVPKFAASNDSATVAETTRAEASILVKPSRALTVPKLEYIWQGSFNVLGTRSHHEMFHGFQAHISTCASNKVFEVATMLPDNVQLDEISYSSSWRVQCQSITPQEENIALFFFAKDIESYERSYKKLMEKMHRDDTALRGNINGIELFVISSNKLPLNSQRWNSMHYLWGMFRVKRYSIPVVGEQKPSFPILNIKSINEDLSVAYIKGVSCSMNSSESSLKFNRFPDSSPPSMVPGEFTDLVDNLRSIESNIKDTLCRTIRSSLFQNCSNQDAEIHEVSVEHLSSLGNSSRTTAMVESRLQMSTRNSGSIEENIGTCQEKLIDDCTNRETGDSPALPCTNAESGLRTSIPAGVECSKIDAKMETSKCSTSAVAMLNNNPKVNVLQTDYPSCESIASRKCNHSCSMERASQPHAEFSNDTGKMERRKKACYASGSSVSDDNLSVQLPPMVQPLYSSVCSQQEQGEFDCSEPLFPRNSAIAEMCLFPMDLGLLKSNKPSDVDSPELSTPNLMLSLGRKIRPTKSMALPLLSFNGDNQQVEPGSLGNNGDVSASLSLSLFIS